MVLLFYSKTFYFPQALYIKCSVYNNTMSEKSLMQVAVDAVVFTVMHDEMKILLIKRKNPPFKDKYALPGGFVEKDEEFKDAVKRELLEETNVKNIFLKKIGAYGKVGRDPRGRVISIAYLALINSDNINLKATSDAASAEWIDIDSLPALAFDHADIISDALKALRFDLQTTNIAFQIMPKRFTLSAMQKLYEDILHTKLDKRNFRKKIAELDLVKETGESTAGQAHRPAMLYTFKQQKYTSLKSKMNVFLR